MHGSSTAAILVHISAIEWALLCKIQRIIGANMANPNRSHGSNISCLEKEITVQEGVWIKAVWRVTSKVKAQPPCRPTLSVKSKAPNQQLPS